LLAGNEAGHVLSRAQQLGYLPDRPHRAVLVADPALDPDTETLIRAVRAAARDTGLGPFVVSQGRSVVVLAEADGRWPEFRKAVGERLGGNDIRVGVGGLCRGTAGLPRSRREAELALKMQQAAGGPAQVTVFDQLGVYRMLAEIEETSSIERFVRDWLGTLLDYDHRKRTDLVPTLGHYLEHGGNYDATARAAAVHRSTLKYRLQRIREISGHDLADPETLFNIQLALRARQTLLALRTPEA
jgi:DNA-binding PucR family transcriptional regulator